MSTAVSVKRHALGLPGGSVRAAHILSIVGLYSLYLLYLGLPRLMRVSDDKAVGYTVVVIVVQLILYFVVGMVVGLLVASFFGSMLMAGAAAVPTVRY